MTINNWEFSVAKKLKLSKNDIDWKAHHWGLLDLLKNWSVLNKLLLSWMYLINADLKSWCIMEEAIPGFS